MADVVFNRIGEPFVIPVTDKTDIVVQNSIMIPGNVHYVDVRQQFRKNSGELIWGKGIMIRKENAEAVAGAILSVVSEDVTA